MDDGRWTEVEVIRIFAQGGQTFTVSLPVDAKTLCIH